MMVFKRESMICAPVRRENPLARGLSTVQAHKPCSIISRVDLAHSRVSPANIRSLWTVVQLSFGKLNRNNVLYLYSFLFSNCIHCMYSRTSMARTLSGP